MTTFEVVEAKPYHCGRIVRQLRRGHHDAVLRLGIDPHKELSDRFRASYFRRAWIIDGQLGALGGICGTILSSTGYIWLAVTELGAQHPLAMVKEAIRQLDEILTTKAELTTLILEDDWKSRRFAEAMGFIVAGDPVPAGEANAIPMRLEAN